MHESKRFPLENKQIKKITPSTLRFVLPARCGSPLLRRQVALERTQRAPLGLQMLGLDPALLEAVRQLMETRQGGTNVTTGASPPELCCGRSARPRDRVEVLRARLLRPE